MSNRTPSRSQQDGRKHQSATTPGDLRKRDRTSDNRRNARTVKRNHLRELI